MGWKRGLKRWLASRTMAYRVMVSALALFVIANGLSQAQKPDRFRLQAIGERLEGKEEFYARSTPDMIVHVGGGSFRLGDLRLVKESGSTKLKGTIVNQTGHRWNQALFEVRAFDASGNQLRGAEERTVFQVNDFERASAQPLDFGYGIWLEGISIESVARLEVVPITDSASKAGLSRADSARLKSLISPDVEE